MHGTAFCEGGWDSIADGVSGADDVSDAGSDGTWGDERGPLFIGWDYDYHGETQERIYYNARRGLLPLEGTGLADLPFPPNWPPKDLRRQRSRLGFDDPQIHADPEADADDPEADSDDELTDNGEDLDPDDDVCSFEDDSDFI